MLGLIAFVSAWVFVTMRVREGLLRQSRQSEGHSLRCVLSECACNMSAQMGEAALIALIWITIAPWMIVSWYLKRLGR